MFKKFIKPELEMIKFETEDIIVTSLEGDLDDIFQDGDKN